MLYLLSLLTDHVNAVGDGAVRQALAAEQTIRRSQHHSVRLTARLFLHRATWNRATLAADTVGPAARKTH
ncbi:hypothetical protein ACGFNU_44210 [Spirillospora sp. NPDC048911]|uniref:hypothetical protein n=1 Tax=Spirillospora sp. NPDC048911 TaxID=3364527 RepID=UPI00371A84CC